MKLYLSVFFVLSSTLPCYSQNSIVGDGFGGRLWYKPFNYAAGPYSGYTLCDAKKRIYAWGDNSYGNLGTGNNTSIILPNRVKILENVKYYSTGYIMAAIKTDASGWVWGTPILNSNSNTIPKNVIDNVKFVDAGIHNCAFVKKDGTVWSVGLNYNGEFGNGILHSSYTSTPQKMLGINSAARTAQGLYSTSVLTSAYEVYITGTISAPTTKIILARKVQGLTAIVDIKAIQKQVIALDSFGNVWNVMDTTNNDIAYKKIDSLHNIVAISGSNDGNHFFALDEYNKVYAWGENKDGQLGSGNNIDSNTPILVDSNVIDIMAGETFSYIIKKDSTLWATGTSKNGSIWLFESNVSRNVFTPINPTNKTIGLCKCSCNGGTQQGNGFVDSSTFEEATIQDTFKHINIYFPNAFTPNGDGKNDVFKIIKRETIAIEKFSLRIYNRYGNLLFSTTNIEEPWNGIGYDIGTYFYYCTYKEYEMKEKEYKGDILLIR